MGPNANLKKEKQCEGTSTQQLLADLTNDFEDAITAQICLSNQLLDAQLGKVENTKDILILKSEETVDTVKSKQLPMESNTTKETLKADDSEPAQPEAAIEDVAKELAVNVAVEVAVVENTNKTLDAATDESTNVEKESIETSTEAVEAPSLDVSNKTNVTEISVAEATVSTATVAKQDASRLTIISVEELPPIRTDSTMTASEVEDNIEERLSQLDGSAVQPLTTNEVSADDHAVAAMGTIPATPPSTPPPASSQQAQQQLPQTPSTPSLSQQLQQQNAFTPQSSTSSVNTMGSTNIPKDFMKDSSAGELEDQDIEEVLKALKGLDSSTADTICDLNVLFNEVYTTLNYEEINSQHASSTTRINPLKEVQAEIEKKQQTMQRKIDYMLRRLRKVQARYMSKHISEEISGLFEWSARIVSRSAKLSHEDDLNERQQLNYAEQKSHPVTATQMTSILRKIELVANAQQLSTSQTNASANLNKRKNKKMISHTNSLATQEGLAAAVEHKIVTVVPTFDNKVTEEIAHVTGLLQSEMQDVQNAIDSDATESSSGGESADEMVTYNNQIQQSLQIAKRAAWRYSRDRAGIAARWSWLLSQISDLEIKIRQHSELHQEIIRTKGTVVKGGGGIEASLNTSSTSTTTSAPFNGYKGAAHASVDTKEINEEQELPGCCRTRGILASNFRKRKLFQTTNIHTFSKKAARPSTIKCGCQWPLHPCALCTGRSDPTAPRDLPDTMMVTDRVALLDPGYHPVLSFPEEISNSIHFEAICRLPEWQQRVMRCPVKHIAKNVWKAEREAAAVKAIMGKKNSEHVKRKYIKKKDLVKEQQQTVNNGNGTGTLSMSSTPLVANKLVKNNVKIARYQQQMNDDHNSKVTTLSTKMLPAMNNNNNYNNSNNYSHQTSDYLHQNCAQFNPSPAHSLSISSIAKNSKNRKLSSSTTVNSTFHYNHQHSLNENNYSNNELNYLHSDSWDSLVTRSRTSSPTHGSSSNYHKYERSLDRRNRASYDIDNIVIPYSVAAATRVELLPYKEIPTPKWRIIEAENEANVTSKSNENDNTNAKEDTSMSSSVCNNKTYIPAPSESMSSAEILVTEKKPKVNNVVTGLNNVEAADKTTPATETKENSIVENNKCRLATKRTYSEKENSVDPLDKTMDSNVNAANSVKESSNETAAKKLKTSEILLRPEAMDLDIAIKAQSIKKEQSLNDDACEEVCTEDITDDAMFLRHERALIEERRKFQTFLKFPWSTRSRANRRIDSRAESSGANTPDPASPAPNTPSVGGGDVESIPSPMAPSTPLNPLDSIAESGETSFLSSGIINNSIAPPPITNCSNKRYERRRTTSAKKDREQERRSSTPDPKEFIPPYEPLKFPIPNEVFDNMIKLMPADHHDDTIDFFQTISTKITKIENNYKIENKRCSNASDKNISSNSIATRLDNREGGGSSEYDYPELGINEADDGYPKHHLAAPDDDYPYEAYKSRKHIGDSDVESSEADPFSDDDPNDPEWKGDSDEKDRIRRKI